MRSASLVYTTLPSKQATMTAPTNNLSARANACTQWTGTDLIVWGGRTGASTVTNTGGIYNSGTNTFTAIPTSANVPVARELTSCAWTGTKLIVWGGWDGSVTLATGSVYDSVAGTWSTITATGAPPARSDLTKGYWTGATGVSATENRFIVWGGYTTGGGTNTGGLYDPATNTWSTITTTGAPATRYYHSIVWTGETGNNATKNRLIVWGGKNASYHGDGAIYNPETNTWSAITATNAPTARSLSTALWTGSKFIIWGGRNSAGNGVNDGAMYDPADNTWTTISATGAPPIRTWLHYDQAWTGSKILIWGGYTFASGGRTINSGAIFDPVANSWVTMGATNVPTARMVTSMGWEQSNNRLIMWGGETGTDTYTNTGGFFYPP